MPIVNRDHSTFSGDGSIVNGSHCDGSGRNCIINGDHVTLRNGDGSIINGDYAKVTCANPSTIIVNGAHCTINGRSMRGRPSGTVVTQFFRNGRTITQRIIGSSDAVLSAPGGVAASHVSGFMVVGGRIVAPPARVSDRERDRSPPPPPALPTDHKCTTAADGERACIVCDDNRIDALLQPCGHVQLCVDCARRIVLESDGRPCPTCRKPIERVVVAHIG